MAKLTPVRSDGVPDSAVEPSAPSRIELGLGPRKTALTVLAVLAVIFTLKVAKDVFLPIVLSILLSYALSPIVERLTRWRIPASISAALLLIAVTIGLGASLYAFSDQISAIVNRIPEAARDVTKSIREQRHNGGPIQQIQKAANELEKAAKEVTGDTRPGGVGGTVVAVPRQDSVFNLHNYLLTGSLGMVAVIIQTVIILFLTYFLLACGDLFKRKFVKIAGSTLSDKKVTVEILSEIDAQIERFLLLQVAISVLVGIATWLALQWIGIEQAMLWGVMGAAATWIPYLGPAVHTGLLMLVGYLQFQTISMALLIGGVLLAIRTIEGMLLVPWLTGRIANMNAVATFISFIFWGWMWGAWGILLAAPIMMSLKVVCDHINYFQGFSELIAD
jgi:predicted PurR-regulated permease PerM